MDHRKAIQLANSNTAAFLPVSLYGHPTQYSRAAWPESKIKVLEDGAQGLGGELWDPNFDDIYTPKTIKSPRKVGSLAHATTFSFYGNKTLTCGEGGMVTTDDDELAAKMRRLRAHGEDPSRKFWFPELGFNYRMSNLHAAIGLAQLERIEDMLIARNRIANGYMERLMPLIKGGRIRTQHFGGLDCRHAWWMFSIVLQSDMRTGFISAHESRRNEIRSRLAADGIETRPILTPLHLMPVYSEPLGRYPIAERIALNGLNLPTYEGLSELEQDYICERIIHHLG
jgi:perosamine synthetase